MINISKEEIIALSKTIEGGDNYAQFLCELANKIDAKVIVELGTNFAATAKMLAGACKDAAIYTIDNNTESEKYVNAFPTFDRLKFKCGDSVELGKVWDESL